MKTPTSSQYPVLDNRPIDQWKVTELKEELKRRKLITRGLKEDLIKRLDEALRTEMEAVDAEGDNGNGVEDPEHENVVTDDPGPLTEQTVVETGDLGVVAPGNAEETICYAEEIMANTDLKNAEVDTVSVEVYKKDAAEQLTTEKSVEEQESGLVCDPAPSVGELTATDASSVVVSDVVSEGLSTEPAVGNEGLSTEPAVGNEGLSTETEVGNEGLQDGKMQRDNEDSGLQLHSEDIKPPHDEDVKKLDSSNPNNQVSEVSTTSLGFPVKSTTNSISADSVSLIEKNDLKDNIIPDNVKLESDVKPEMMQPSSSELAPDGGKSHPRDVDEPHHANKVSVEETDNSNADLSQKNYSGDLGSSEKLNLDRSSGDDSMEEDALESKQIVSNYTSEEVGEKIEISEVTTIKEESPVTAMDTDLPAERKRIHSDSNDVLATSFDKRKLSDQEVVLNNEPAKRQRRWKSESNNVMEPRKSNLSPLAATQDVPHSAALKRNLSRSDSTGASDTPKEREVPLSAKAPTNSLRIDRFLRPFTLKAVQELLGKTGSVTSFWMDHIKTHCYVTYSSVEEAVETRNAVYNLQWPPNGGRQLLAEFVEPEEVKLRLEPPPQPPVAPVNSAPTKAPEPPMPPQPSPRQQSLRQQMAQQPTLPPPPPLTNQVPAREWAHPPPPPPLEKVDAPIVTLDDLFRKTKATPRIYYLPLSEEQVSAVLEARSKSSKQ